ncbi:MAG: hypothetical protein AB1938_16780 [Myxococcota bacterium]
MEPTPPVISVEFEHRRFVPPAAPGPRALKLLGPGGVPGLTRRIRIVRAVFVIAGALGIAFATERSGVALGAALCVFLGALPLLWVVGWLAGVLLTTRRLAVQTSKALEGLDLQAELAKHQRVERVRLELRDDGLWLERKGVGEDESRSIDWRKVGFTRRGPQSAVVFVGPQDFLEIPSAAFPDAAAFDAFCLALQARVWRAES